MSSTSGSVSGGVRLETARRSGVAYLEEGEGEGEGESEGEEERRGRGAVEVHSKERMEKGWMSLYCPLNGVGGAEGR